MHKQRRRLDQANLPVHLVIVFVGVTLWGALAISGWLQYHEKPADGMNNIILMSITGLLALLAKTSTVSDALPAGTPADPITAEVTNTPNKDLKVKEVRENATEEENVNN